MDLLGGGQSPSSAASALRQLSAGFKSVIEDRVREEEPQRADAILSCYASFKAKEGTSVLDGLVRTRIVGGKTFELHYSEPLKSKKASVTLYAVTHPERTKLESFTEDCCIICLKIAVMVGVYEHVERHLQSIASVEAVPNPNSPWAKRG